MIATTFDEKARRLPTFDPDSVPAGFGGVTLYLPRPRVMIRRRRGEDGKSQAVVTRTFGPAYDGLIDAVELASTAGDVTDLAAALFELAADLLGRNYSLTEEELDGLLAFDPMGGMREPWATVWAVALGGSKPAEAVPGKGE